MHVLHICKKVDPTYMEALGRLHGWEKKERPLNVDVSRLTGETKHPTCPDCGEETEKMEKASALDVQMLSSTITGGRNRPERQARQENVGLTRALKDITERLARIEGKKSEKGEQGEPGEKGDTGDTGERGLTGKTGGKR